MRAGPVFQCYCQFQVGNQHCPLGYVNLYEDDLCPAQIVFMPVLEQELGWLQLELLPVLEPIALPPSLAVHVLEYFLVRGHVN
jgi:hypothetical protein